MKVVVFGAAGWLGRAVLSNLNGRHEIRAVDYSPDAWKAWEDIDGPWDQGEIVQTDMADFSAVDLAVEGMDAIIQPAVYFPREVSGYGEEADKAFLTNLKGLWNILEAARKYNVKRVVHIGSCQTVHPNGIFFTADVRRPDGSLYAVNKRLQEEMCRQYHDAFGTPIIVLRPDYIVDSRIGLGRQREKLGPEGTPTHNGWVCRHDLAEACRLAIESTDIDFDIFHIVGTPEADATCNVARSREVLGLEYRGDLEQYR